LANVPTEFIDFEDPRSPGTAYCRGTGVRVLSVLAYFWANPLSDDFRSVFPGLTSGHIAACRAYARSLSDETVGPTEAGSRLAEPTQSSAKLSRDP
jgi:uncharacterized protein (DUF433 family)